MNRFLIAFSVLSSIHLGLECTSSEFTLYSKPLLMPALGLFLLSKQDWNPQGIKQLLLALVFSTAGDILLMFSDQSQYYFLGGLLSFLLAHLFYIVFYKQRTASKSIQKNLSIFLSLYLLGFLYLLKPGLNGILLIAVPIYAGILAYMVYSAIQAGEELYQKDKILLGLGAMSFLISDSLIGFFAFTDYEIYLPLQRLLIMSTYLLAQYLIISRSNLLVERFPSKQH